MNLKELVEAVIGEQPSSGAVIEFPLANEMKDTVDAINNYSTKTVEEFNRRIKSKFQNKTISFGQNTITAKDVVVNLLPNMKLNIIFVDEKGQEIKYNGSDSINIHNDQEAPTTALTKNTYQQTSANKLQHF